MSDVAIHRVRARALARLRHLMASPAMAAQRGQAAVAKLIQDTDVECRLTSAERSDLTRLFDHPGNSYGAARRSFIRKVKAMEDAELASIGESPPSQTDPAVEGGSSADQPAAQRSSRDDLQALQELMALQRLHKDRRQAGNAAPGQRPSGRPSRVGAATAEQEWDVFLSFAAEDNDSFVRDLAHALRSAGLRVWYDEFRLAIGDGLHTAINE